MIRNIPQFLIAAPTSGTGKTTVSRLLMTLLTQKKLRVQPYKCGPDYIDTKYHEKACGIPSYNLDLFMASEHHVCKVYNHHAVDADVCIVEGMMGMFDGYDRSKGSSAEIAKVLRLPVVLVVSAKAAAYSLAAMIKDMWILIRKWRWQVSFSTRWAVTGMKRCCVKSAKI